jgi:hypothetical protein
MEHGLQVVAGEPGLVRIHAAQIPELATDLVQSFWRATFEDHPHRSALAVDSQFAVVEKRGGADDDDGSQVIEARMGQQRRDIGGVPLGRLRRYCGGAQRD